MKVILVVFVKVSMGGGAGGKTAVFGLLKQNGKVYTVVVKDTKQSTLTPIITRKIKPESIFTQMVIEVTTLLT